MGTDRSWIVPVVPNTDGNNVHDHYFSISTLENFFPGFLRFPGKKMFICAQVYLRLEDAKWIP
jgi:hypothetical protein